MSLEQCTDKIRQKLAKVSDLNATLKFDCESDGVIYIDGISMPNQVHNDNQEANCTITLTLANLLALLSGELNPMTGVMLGKLKISGDMGVVMRLKELM
jgi:putative sterol carrier protein